MVVERAAQADEMPYSELASFYERHIPNPDPAKPSYRQLIRLTVADREVIGQCWLGRGHVEVRHPLHSRLDRAQAAGDRKGVVRGIPLEPAAR